MREDEIATKLGDFLFKKNYMAVQVNDNSWKEAGVNKGDYLIVRRQENAENGRLVMTYEKRRLHLRKACYDGKTMLLHSPYPDIPPIKAAEEPSENGFILGQVVEVRKYYR